MIIKNLIKKSLSLLSVTAIYILSATNISESEILNITTYYPAPYGAYVSMLTTNNTWLARDAGVVGIRTGATAVTFPLTIGGGGGVFGVDNQATFLARNATGTYESYMWPRWSDNVMYMNYGTGGFNIRNNASVNTMFMTDNNMVGIGGIVPGFRLDVNGDIRIQNGNFQNMCYYQWYTNTGTVSCSWGRVAGFIPNATGTNLTAQLYPSGAWTVFTAESSRTGWLICCRINM